MQKYYDDANHRLVFVGRPADSPYWDSHWSSHSSADFAQYVRVVNPIVSRYTHKYLMVGSRVLEGGCGRGQNVYTLHNSGYAAYGVDYASQTVARIHTVAPELNVVTGDVRALDFPDGFFDGYWSLGVIEHFLDGYELVLREMHRVTRKDGFVFLTVPDISSLRRLKVSLRGYAGLETVALDETCFYQYAFSKRCIVSDFAEHGFRLIEHRRLDGLKGIKDEVGILHRPLQRLYDSKSFVARAAKRVVDYAVREWANHICFYIFRKTDDVLFPS